MLIVVRHGRTAANAAGRLLGHLDVDLDDEGRRQAAALAAAVGSVDRVVSSPLRRCRQTAEVWGAPVEEEPRWIEMDYGALDGVAMADVAPDLMARWRADPAFAPVGGESLIGVGRRVRGACEELRAAATDQDIVVVTHVSPIKAACAWAMGVGDEVAWRMFVAPASITRIAVTDRGPSLHGFNDTGHLR